MDIVKMQHRYKQYKEIPYEVKNMKQNLFWFDI